MPKLLITGAFGKVGTALLSLPYEMVLLDRAVPSEYSGKPNVFGGELRNGELLARAIQGCTVVVHLAASASVESSWNELLHDNIIGTYYVLQAAREAGVHRVIFASSHHVVGMLESHNAPQIYEAGHEIVATKKTETCPDSLYGVSKVFGESLGRYMAENGGPRFYALRIGSVHAAHEDHPYAEAEAGVRNGMFERESALYELKVKRQKALWLSRRDLRQLVQKTISYDGPQFDVFYGVSDNATRWLDIDYARTQLNYQPEDGAEAWTKAPVVTA